MEWEQHFCPNQSCAVDFWLVRQAAHQHELWHVISRFGGAFTVAATDPACPRCGTTLSLSLDLAQQAGGGILEDGPMLEFIRSIT